MALTETQRAAVRLYLGWSARFHQFDSRLEQALDAVGSLPESAALITASISSTPPGLLALLADLESRIRGAYGRLKAGKVGSIELNAGEIGQLRSEGRRLVGQLATLLGVEVGSDPFGPGVGRFGPSGGAPTFIGK
jgi:hypothetical protein